MAEAGWTPPYFYRELRHNGETRMYPGRSFSEEGLDKFLEDIKISIAMRLAQRAQENEKRGEPMPVDMGVCVMLAFGEEETDALRGSMPEEMNEDPIDLLDD